MLFWTSIILANLLAVLFWLAFERHYRKLAKALKQRLAQPSGTLERAASRRIPAG